MMASMAWFSPLPPCADALFAPAWEEALRLRAWPLAAISFSLCEPERSESWPLRSASCSLPARVAIRSAERMVLSCAWSLSLTRMAASRSCVLASLAANSSTRVRIRLLLASSASTLSLVSLFSRAIFSFDAISAILISRLGSLPCSGGSSNLKKRRPSLNPALPNTSVTSSSPFKVMPCAFSSG